MMEDEVLTQEELNVEEETVYTEPSNTSEEVYSEPAVKTPNEIVRRNDALDDAIRASEKGEDPRDAFEAKMFDPNYEDEDRTARIDASLDNIYELQEQRLSNKIASGSPIDAEVEAKRFKGISDAANDALAESRLFVLSHPNSGDYTPEEVDNAAWLHYARGKAAEVMGEMDWLDIASDFLGFVAVPQENFRVSDVAELIGADFTAGDLYDTTEFMSGLIAKFMTESPESRVKLVDHIISSWSEIKGDNRLALVDFLSKLSGDFNADMSHLENTLERTDQAAYLSILPKVVKGAMRGLGALSLIREMKSLEAAADAVKAGSKGELRTAGVTPLDAASTLNPMSDIPNLVKGSGASPEVTEGINRINAQVEIFTNEIDKFNDPGLGLSIAEKESAMVRAEQNFDEAYEGVSNVKAVELDNNDFSITFDVVDSTGKLQAKGSQTVSYTRGDIDKGFMEGTEKGHRDLGKFITSPLFRFKEGTKAARALVQMPEQMMSQGAKIRALYDGAIRQSLKGLNKKSRKRVEGLLLEGDEFADSKGQLVGKVFNRDEAVNKKGLTNEEYDAYLGMRGVVDHMHKVKDLELVRDRNARGIKTLSWDGQELPVKVYENFNDAKSGFSQAEVKSYWIATDDPKKGVRGVDKFNTPGELNADDLARKYNEGYVLVKGDNKGLLPNGDHSVEWAFVRRGSLKRATGGLLNKRTGYMPKIRKDAFYFVKEVVPVKVGNKDVTQLKTIRYFDNKADADTFKSSMNWYEGTTDKYKVLADKEMLPSELEAEHITLSGGLFKGSRKSTEIPFGLPSDKRKGERVDGLGGLQRYVNNIAKNMPMGVYRIGLQQRWLKHAKDLGALPPGYTGDFAKAVHELVPGKGANPFLKDSHGQIKFLSGIPSDQEEKMASAFRSWAETFEGYPKFGGKWMARRINNTSEEAMAGLARGLTFHLMLGMYNPAQFLIQGSGALVALTVNPVHGLKALPTAMGAGLADLAIGNPSQIAKFTKHLASKGLLDEEAYLAWRKSGLLEGTTHASLDYHSIWNDVPYDANVFRRAMGNGDVFYKSGELFNSRVSFFTSYNRWKEANPGRKITDLDIQDISFRAEEYRLNMSKVNSSKFQKGIVSVPTQFQKVSTSFFEKIIGDSFTPTEKIRLVLGQAALFGGAGVPLVSSLTPIMLDTLGINIENSSPGELKAYQAGVLGWLLTDHLDINSVITGRMTLGTDFIEKYFEAATGAIVVPDVLTGPFGNIWDRADNLFDQLTTIFGTVINGGEDLTAGDYAAVGNLLLRSFSGIASSTSNITKTYDLTHSEFYRDKNGRAIVEWEDNNLQTIVAQAGGFAPDQIPEWYEFNARERGIPVDVKKDDAKRLAWLLGSLYNESDAVRAKFTAMAMNVIRTKYVNAQPWEFKEVQEDLMRQIKDPTQTMYDKHLAAAKEVEREVVDGLSALSRQSKIRTDPGLAKALQEGEK